MAIPEEWEENEESESWRRRDPGEELEDRSDSLGFLVGSCSVLARLGVRGTMSEDGEETLGERRAFLAPSRDFCELRDKFMIFMPLLRGEGFEDEVAGLWEDGLLPKDLMGVEVEH